jgi:hypothetical protein
MNPRMRGVVGTNLMATAELEAMQQQVADTAPQPQTEYVVSAPKRRGPTALLPALLGAVIMGGGAAPDPFSRSRSRSLSSPKLPKHNPGAAEKARAKRDRKNAVRLRSLRCQGGR